jgi:hypothetical protein
MFKPQDGCVVVLIDDGHGWRTYDSAFAGGNYMTDRARCFWDSLVRQGFTTDYYQGVMGTNDYEQE